MKDDYFLHYELKSKSASQTNIIPVLIDKCYHNFSTLSYKEFFLVDVHLSEMEKIKSTFCLSNYITNTIPYLFLVYMLEYGP